MISEMITVDNEEAKKELILQNSGMKVASEFESPHHTELIFSFFNDENKINFKDNILISGSSGMAEARLLKVSEQQGMAIIMVPANCLCLVIKNSIY